MRIGLAALDMGAEKAGEKRFAKYEGNKMQACGAEERLDYRSIAGN